VFNTSLSLGDFPCTYAKSLLLESEGEQFSDGQPCRASCEIITYMTRRSGSCQRDGLSQIT